MVLKHWGEKFPDSSKKQNLNQPRAKHCAKSLLRKSCVGPRAGAKREADEMQILRPFTGGIEHPQILAWGWSCPGTNALSLLLYVIKLTIRHCTILENYIC